MRRLIALCLGLLWLAFAPPARAGTPGAMIFGLDANSSPDTVTLPSSNDYWFTQNYAGTGNGTQVPSYWVNKVGGELDSLINQCGTLNMSTYNQVLTCVDNLIAFYINLIPTPHGLLLSTTVLTGSGTFTPASGANRLEVEIQGGGGTGGAAAATDSTHMSVGSGGAGGAYARISVTSGFSSVSYSTGAGAASVFGSIATCPAGGNGGVGTAAINSVGQVGQGGVGGPCTISGATTLINSQGIYGPNGLFLNAGPMSGQGGGGAWGGGGGNNNLGAGQVGLAPGAGGAGAACNVSCAGYAGGTGAAGIIIVRQYS